MIRPRAPAEFDAYSEEPTLRGTEEDHADAVKTDINMPPVEPSKGSWRRPLRPLPTGEALDKVLSELDGALGGLEASSSGTTTRLPHSKEADAGVNPESHEGDDDHALDRTFELCLSAVRALDRAIDDSEQKLVPTLVRVMEMHEHACAHADAFNRLLKKRRIRITRATDAFNAVVNLAFSESRKKRSNASRNAAALRYAAGEGSSSENLAAFFRQNHGVAECAKRGRRDRSNSASAKTHEKREARLAEGRNSGVVFANAALFEALKTPFASLLVEATEGGKIRVLGMREEDESAINRFDFFGS